MKVIVVKTASGSIYRFRETPDGIMETNYGQTKLNPYVSPTFRNDEWLMCQVLPWPPEVGASLRIYRPVVPFGQGQDTRTSLVKEVVEEEIN